MAGPLKRTSLRSSPEDAALYRKYHDSTLSWLRKGVPHAELVRELIRLGVPDKTAERIVFAVAHENAHFGAPQKAPVRPTWLIQILIVVVLMSAAGIGGYVYSQVKRGETPRAGYVVPGAITLMTGVTFAMRGIFRRPRGPQDLPPPPKPPT